MSTDDTSIFKEGMRTEANMNPDWQCVSDWFCLNNVCCTYKSRSLKFVNSQSVDADMSVKFSQLVII